MQPRKISIALVCGLIAGLAMILLTFLLYRGGVKTYLGATAYFGYLILVVLAIIAPIMKKKAQNGYLEFRDALKACFLVFVIALALQTIFNWVLLNYIDPTFRQAVEKSVMQSTEKLLLDMGISQDKIDEVQLREKGTNQFSLGRTMMGLAFWYLAWFLVALLIAAIIKKKKPEFSETEFK